MAKIIDTSQMDPAVMSSNDSYWAYNGLDCCVTVEVFGEVMTQHNERSVIPYHFSRAMQGPALMMMLRGIHIDQSALATAIYDLERTSAHLEKLINRYAQAVWEADLNANSPKQLDEFFYRHMRFPEVVLNFKGVRRASTNREALEKLQAYYHARPIILAILAYREVRKKLGVLRSGVDSDGRMRTSYNVAGTETRRWSSSSNAFGGGTNLQNITEELRYVFAASKGKKMGYSDLEQAESKVVGLLSWLCTGDDSYLRACESGDLHTYVSRLVWPKMPWTGDLKKDKEIAGQPFYRHFSYRDMAKRGGHGTNYYGQPWNMARQLKVETKLMEEFQDRYFGEFPGIPGWHKYTAQQLQTKGYITTLLGATRVFFGRLGDDSTLREAIAHEPQSIIGELLNRGLYEVWQKLDFPGAGVVDLLGQVHDAIIFEFPEELEREVVPEITKCLVRPMVIQGRPFSIGAEIMTGWNWGKMVTQSDIDKAVLKGQKIPRLNVGGLAKWTGKDDRKRSFESPFGVLGQLISGVHARPAHPDALP